MNIHSEDRGERRLKTGVVCFGEVLWDELPDGPVPGGAPMNAAIRLASLGHTARIISAVGKDERGEQLTAVLRENGVDPSLLQRHPELPTGAVHVSLDPHGNPSYDIALPSAWDDIAVTRESIDAVHSSAVFIFGSLACRRDSSLSTLRTLLKHAPLRVFDVNLRSPFFSLPIVRELMRQADIIKMNDEELLVLTAGQGADGIEQGVLSIAEQTSAKSICITRGENGAVVYDNGSFIHHPGYRVEVVDTVGAGDSFLAGFVSELLRGEPLTQALAFGCALGAMVAGRKGANPAITAEEIDRFMEEQ